MWQDDYKVVNYTSDDNSVVLFGDWYAWHQIREYTKLWPETQIITFGYVRFGKFSYNGNPAVPGWNFYYNKPTNMVGVIKATLVE